MRLVDVVRRSRRLLVPLAIGVVLGTLLMAPPAGAHFQASIKHIWKHIRGKADVRYVNAVPGTNKAPRAAEADGVRRVVRIDSATVLVNAGEEVFGSVDCPAGTHVVGGGVAAQFNSVINSSWPTSATTWAAYVRNNNGGGTAGFQVYALCIRAGGETRISLEKG